MERFDKDGNVLADGKFDSEGNDLKFDDKGEVIEPEISLHDAHKQALEGDEPKLDELDDDDQLFLDDDLDDLFEEVPDIDPDETEEDKVKREAEEERLLEEAAAKKLALKKKDDKPDENADELAAARKRIKELELGDPSKTGRREIPADDTPITSVGDLKKLQEDMAFNEQLDKSIYQTNYMKSFYNEAFDEGMTDAEANALFDFLILPENEKSNQMHSQDGKSDAMINFNKIMRIYNKEEKKELNLQHKKVDKENLLHAKPSMIKTKKRVKTGKLDKFAKRFIEKVGMKDDDVVEALSGTSGIRSKGGRAI